MMPVTVAFRPREAGNQHIGMERSDHSHHVSQCDVVPSPLLESLFWILRITEVRDPAETLLHSAVTVRRGQLECAKHTQHITQIASNLVLAAFAASEAHQERSNSFAARFER